MPVDLVQVNVFLAIFLAVATAHQARLAVAKAGNARNSRRSFARIIELAEKL